MIKFKSQELKYLKFIHLFFVIMWVGAAMIMAVISWIEPIFLKNDMYTLYIFLDIIDDYAIIPGAIATLLTGLIYGIFTNWGFFKYRWILVKWIIMIAQIFCGTFLLHPLVIKNIDIAHEIKDISVNNPVFLNNQLLLHIGGSIQLVMFIFLCYISVMKPWIKSKDRSPRVYSC